MCRPGFEKECAGEIIQIANRQVSSTYIQARENSGIVYLVSHSNAEITGLIHTVAFKQLVFSRQWMMTTNKALSLPDNNRLPAILNTIKKFDCHVQAIEMDYADTNEGKALNKFCRQFKPHLLEALQQHHLLNDHAPWRLHLFFHHSQQVDIGLSPVANSAQHAMGITRLKMPAAAPSRSTLKLEEAIHWFLSPARQQKLLVPGMHAVDLGAAPGGWSWQLVQRGCLVTAIDNGPMQDALMHTGMVEHLQTDAFTYAPAKKVDWLVCDMAERPLHVSRLIARWFKQQQCSHAIFNLKLPMKKRLACVQECLALLDKSLSSAKISYYIQAKQLYHDREEMTVCIIT